MTNYGFTAHGVQYVLDDKGRTIAACSHSTESLAPRPTVIKRKRRRPVQTAGQKLAALFA